MSEKLIVTDSSFEDEILNADLPVLVDFWAAWCGPCKMIAPILDELADEMDGQILIGKMDIDENPSTPMAYGVMSIPTLLLFKDGQPVERIIGFKPKDQLVGDLQPHL